MTEKSIPLPERKPTTPAARPLQAPVVPGVTRLRAWPRSVRPEDQDRGRLTDLKKDELIAKAEEAGVEASGTKAEIIERIEAPAEPES